MRFFCRHIPSTHHYESRGRMSPQPTEYFAHLGHDVVRAMGIRSGTTMTQKAVCKAALFSVELTRSPPSRARRFLDQPGFPGRASHSRSRVVDVIRFLEKSTISPQASTEETGKSPLVVSKKIAKMERANVLRREPQGPARLYLWKWGVLPQVCLRLTERVEE